MCDRLGLHVSDAGFAQLMSPPYSEWIALQDSSNSYHPRRLETIEDVKQNGGLLTIRARKGKSYVEQKAQQFIMNSIPA